MILAQKNPFGTIKPPTGLERFGTNPTESLGNLLGVGLKLFFVLSGLTALLYMVRGAFDWITSGGEKEKVAAAQQRIQNAVLGLFVLIGVLAVIGALEQLVFKEQFCFGLTCAIELSPVK